MTLSARLVILGTLLIASAGGCTESPSTPTDSSDEPQGIEWIDGSFEEAAQLAGSEDKLLLIYGMASWCSWCRRMSQITWSDSTVIEWVDMNAVAFEWDIDSPTLTAELKGMLHITAVPTVVVLSSGAELARKVGYASPEEYLNWFESLPSEVSSVQGRPGVLGTFNNPSTQRTDLPTDQHVEGARHP